MNDQRLRRFSELFSGRLDAYGMHDLRTGRSWMEKSPPTINILKSHLEGERLVGVYPLLPNGTTRLGVIDIDSGDGNDALDCVRSAIGHGFQVATELSKSKGFHTWFLFDDYLPSADVRRLLGAVCADAGVAGAEIFPKQDSLRVGGYGNSINLPLCGVEKGYQTTVFLDRWLRRIPNQWEYLDTIVPNPASRVRAWKELNPEYASPIRGRKESKRGQTYGLVPCVQQMLADGVTAFQRVACFRIAVALRKSGMPEDLSLQVLQSWAPKNRPQPGKRRITLEEISSQVAAAYRTAYMGCGCAEQPMVQFCVEDCPVYRKRD